MQGSSSDDQSKCKYRPSISTSFHLWIHLHDIDLHIVQVRKTHTKDLIKNRGHTNFIEKNYNYFNLYELSEVDAGAMIWHNDYE